jgi:hypothetical protein
MNISANSRYGMTEIEEEKYNKKRDKEYFEHKAEIAKLRELIKFHKRAMEEIERYG